MTSPSHRRGPDRRTTPLLSVRSPALGGTGGLSADYQFQNRRGVTSRAIFPAAVFAPCVRGGLRTAHLTVVQPAPNFCGPLDRWFFPLRIHACKQPRGGLSKCFEALSVTVAVHERQRIEGFMSWVTRKMSRVAKCL